MDFEASTMREEVAIIGMAGHFPGARNISQFWHNLREGVESIETFTPEQLSASGVDKAMLENSAWVNKGAVMENADCFDATFFGFSPLEAEIMDPQHRMFLECAWEALEDAGYDPETYHGPIGVFGGVALNTYFPNILLKCPDVVERAGHQLMLLANEKDYAVSRVSFKLNLKGPSINANTACSSSGVALHMACQSVLSGESDMALVGGVKIHAPLRAGYLYQEGGILSPDGHCRAFDAQAQGTRFGSGVAMIVVKRLSDALEHGDTIHAVVKGTAVNNDGALKVGFTAPSIQGQAEVIEEALNIAEVSPDSIGYVEAHGTGTSLGDPIEIAALTKAYRNFTERTSYCPIGSVKTNIGHLDAAAGIVGIIKTVLALKHKQIPASLNFNQPNPQIDFSNSPFYVNTSLSDWHADGIPRRAGVSSFGLGGTNAHIILEEAPDTEPSGTSRAQQLLLISAKSEDALNTATSNLVTYWKNNPQINPADIAYTLQIGRRAFEWRRMVVCHTPTDCMTALETRDPERVLSYVGEPMNRDVVFMFTGQGSQYVAMGLELYRSESTFRAVVDRCAEILQPSLSLDIRDILYPEGGDLEEIGHRLEQTRIAQPALFTIEYALAQQWMSWGINPSAMVGHSIGEYVAACLAGVFTLEDVLSLVATRGRLMQELSAGSMLAVPLTEAEIQPFLGQHLSLATVNTPGLCVVSGEKQAVDDLQNQLASRDVACRPLHTSHAFHSEMMEPILPTFTECVKQVRRHSPQIPYLSNVSGTWITPDEAMDPVYWSRHLRQTVRFSDCVGKLLKESNRVFLEVGPGQTLSTLVKRHPNRFKEQIVLSSIRHPKEQKSDIEFILTTLGRLWLAGIQIDWSGFYKDERRHRIPLPTYPFERQRYWIEPLEQPRGFLGIRAGLIGKGRERFPQANIPISRQDDEIPQESEFPGDYTLARDSEKQRDVVAPSNEVEHTIVDIWQKLFGIERIGVHDNFFDLGGDSLLAPHFFSQIEKQFNKRIPLATLFDAPTVEQIAKIIMNDDWSWSPLVALQVGGVNPPFFCIHGADGDIFVYRNLARHLGSYQPFYGLQSQGLDGKQPFLTRIEDMASRYIEEIQTVQPEGPYFLGGYCMGGTIALEMAQQLYAQGQKVDLLVLLETYNWANLKRPSIFSKTHHYAQKIAFHWQNLLLAESKWTFLHEKIKVAKNRRKVWSGSLRTKVFNNFHQSNGYNELLHHLWETNDRAVLSYVPKVYPGKITLFSPLKHYARYDTPELCWENMASGGVEIHTLPVFPAGMLMEPFVKTLSAELKTCMAKTVNGELKN